MRLLSILIFSTLILVACQKKESESGVQDLESRFQENPSLTLGDSLLAIYNKQVSQMQESEDASPVLFSAGRVADQINRIPEAISYYQMILKTGQNQDFRVRAAAELIDVFENKLKKEFATRCLKAGFVKEFPTHQLSSNYKTEGAQSDDIESLLADKAAMMFAPETQALDRMAAIDYVDGCEIFAMLHKGDQRTPDILHKGAETARTLRTYDKAISFYDWIYNEYPDHPKAPQALFLKAFTLDDNLNKMEMAQSLYIEFIEKYPDNDFADDAQFLLDNLGKTDEEILESLMK